MTENDSGGPAGGGVSAPSPAGRTFPRLVVIPILIYAAWCIETFLLEGNLHTFSRFSPPNLVLYTIVVCIVTGVVVPVLAVSRSFRAGDVNMFQIGFRSPRRTLAACAVTAAIGYAAVVLANPFGTDRFAFAASFLLLLPTAMASVMVCWVLIGTHLQAFVRAGGSLVTIPTGVAVTGFLFGLTPLVHSGTARLSDTIPWFIAAGILGALFFFALRDVYASTIAVALMEVFLTGGGIDPAFLLAAVPWTAPCAGCALLVLAGIHAYLSRNFTTVRIPEIPGRDRRARP